MEYEKYIADATKHFENLLREQLERVEKIKNEGDWIDYASLPKILIGVAGGDGIGPYITEQTQRVLEFLLRDRIDEGKVEFRKIEGLTIENRVKHMQAVPDDVLENIKKCHILLKGPTTTPKKGDPWPNIESANVAIRRALDLFANVRPVRVPEQGIDWVFFRENTEGAYMLGSKGVMVGNELAMDFKVITQPGAERIIRLAFDYAKKNGRKRVTVVTKANVVKKTDGLFLEVAEKVAKEYPEIEWDDWFIDIMTAKLIDPARRAQFDVMVLPNLYGDILTDEAAQIQGGVGTAGSANIGKKYAMFEAIHGTALRMVKEGRGKYANPTSMLKAGEMMLEHLGFLEEAKRLRMAMDICTTYEKKLVVTGRADGATGAEFTDYVIETLKDKNLEERWNKYQE